MQKITDPKDLLSLTDGNIFIGTPPAMTNSDIRIKGKNNILYCAERVDLNNSSIVFEGNNSLVFLSSSKSTYSIHISVYNNSVVHFGTNNSFNNQMHLVASEQKHIFIGDDCMFSLGIWIRTADPHLIYDANTKERKNKSKSVFIGDHVWIGQNALILKGSKIYSGSIIGAGGITTNKNIPSNESWAGSPCRKITDNIFWDKKCVHAFTDEKTAESMILDNDDFIFDTNESERISFMELDAALDKCKNAQEKYDYILSLSRAKNRFAFKPEIKLPWYKSLFKK